jgi:hypothetical protein
MARQRERQIHVAEPARAFDADPLQPDWHSQMIAPVIEQRRLLRCADQPSRECAGRKSSVLIEFAEMRHRLLDHRRPTRTQRTGDQ